MNSCLNMFKSLNSVFVIWMILHNIYHLMVKLYQGRRLWSMRESWPRFSSCLQGKGSAMLNKQIRNYLDKVTKAHVIGLMLDDRWMYQKIEGCLLPLQRLPEFQSFSPPLTKTYCKMSRAMPSMMGTSLAYHIIGYKPHEGNIGKSPMWNCPNFCQVSTRDIWIQATTAAPGVWGVLRWQPDTAPLALWTRATYLWCLWVAKRMQLLLRLMDGGKTCNATADSCRWCIYVYNNCIMSNLSQFSCARLF